nr:hypothetical protein [Mycoplasmopsis bovis]
MQEDKLKIKNKKKTVVVLVIHLRILPHKLKVIKTEQEHKSKEKVSKKMTPQIQDSSSTEDNPTRLKVGSKYGMLRPQTKDKEQEENRSGSGNSSTDTAPQTQDIQKQENKNKEKEKKITLKTY